MIEIEEFLFRQWNDGCVVFDRLQGCSHAFHAEAVDVYLGADVSRCTGAQVRTMIETLSASPSPTVVSLEPSQDSFQQDLLPAVHPN